MKRGSRFPFKPIVFSNEDSTRSPDLLVGPDGQQAILLFRLQASNLPVM